MADERLTVDAGINSEGVETGMNDITSKIKQGMNAIGNMASSGMESFKNSITSAVSASTVAIAGLSTGAVASIKGMVEAGDEYNKAINQLSASTGAVGEELEGMEDIVQGVYGNNFGESWDDVANTVAEIQKQTGLMGDELQSASEGALALSDTFEMDVGESTRAVSSLMKNFGISSEEAYNLIAMGAQNGANQNDDLLDTLNEYSAQYSALGLSADEFMQSLISGADAGVFSIDKVGDAVKEFNIRAKDGSASSAEGFQLLGLDAEEMTSKFAQGGDTAQQAFYQVVNALNEMDDPVAKNTAAVDLFGTMYEDLESNMLPILSSMQGASENTYDALGQINEVKYNDIGSAMEGLKRSIGNLTIDMKSELAGGIAGALGSLVNTINSFDGDYSVLVQGIAQAGKDMISAFAPLISNFKEKATLIVSTISDGIQEKMPIIVKKVPEILLKLAQGFITGRQKMMEVAIPLITSLAEGILQHGSELISLASTLITGICNAIMTFLPTLIPIATQLIQTLVTGIQTLLPNIIPVAIEIILALINGILGALPTLMVALPQIIFAIVNGILEHLTDIIVCAIQIVMAIVTGIIENVTLLLSAVISIVMTIVNLVLENLPMLINVALEIVMALVNGILQNLSPLLEMGIQLVLELVNALLQNLEPILGATIEMIMAIVDGLSSNMETLISCAILIIETLIQGITDNLELIINCAIKLIVQLATGLVQAIPKLVAVIPQIIDAIWNAITSVDWLDLGVNVLKGIADGLISGLSSIGDTISNVADGIVNGFKDFFGIHSPSTLFRDEIGSYLPQGLAVGVDAQMNTTADDINKSLESMMSGIDVNGMYSQMQNISVGSNVPMVSKSKDINYTQPQDNTTQENNSSDRQIVVENYLFKNSQKLNSFV
ncbi:MAG: phage tail tape measure protein, partial [Ruminococcus sp.]|nr:phage tail tape measure protein [Ruminococcus sp.]